MAKLLTRVIFRQLWTVFLVVLWAIFYVLLGTHVLIVHVYIFFTYDLSYINLLIYIYWYGCWEYVPLKVWYTYCVSCMWRIDDGNELDMMWQSVWPMTLNCDNIFFKVSFFLIRKLLKDSRKIFSRDIQSNNSLDQ